MLSFCKIDILENFRKIHMKTPVPESLFNRVTGLLSVTLLKRNSDTGVFLLMLPNFLEHLFRKNLRGTVSKMSKDFIFFRSW